MRNEEENENSGIIHEIKQKLENIELSEQEIMNIVEENDILKRKIMELSGKLVESRFKSHEAQDNLEMMK